MECFCRRCRSNLSIIRFNCKTKVKPEYMGSKSRYSVYESWEFYSCIEAVVVGGDLGFHRKTGFS